MTSVHKGRRLLLVVALVLAAGAFAFLAFGNIGDNLVYYWSPTELLEAGDKARGASIRLGGMVAHGSIERPDGSELAFLVTDGTNTVPVRSNAVPPAMFREGIGVVVEGTIGATGEFETQRLMVKHDNEYRPPGEDDERDMEDLVRTMQFEGDSG